MTADLAVRFNVTRPKTLSQRDVPGLTANLTFTLTFTLTLRPDTRRRASAHKSRDPGNLNRCQRGLRLACAPRLLRIQKSCVINTIPMERQCQRRLCDRSLAPWWVWPNQD